jgi:hypothetical protein
VDGSWWETTGGVVLVTGVISILSIVAGFVLRPWVERRLRREQRREERAGDAEAVAIDLQALLVHGFQERARPEDRARALHDWSESISRRLLTLVTFAPSNDTRKKAGKLWREFHRLSVWVPRLVEHGVPVFGSKEALTFDEDYGEASFALVEFIESIGGRRPRNEASSRWSFVTMNARCRGVLPIVEHRLLCWILALGKEAFAECAQPSSGATTGLTGSWARSSIPSLQLLGT